MNIELWPLDLIRPYEKNPRRNDAVVASIRTFGFRQPIVVDAEGVIVVGHTRWKAAKALGLDEVPVHIAHELTPEQAVRQAKNVWDTINGPNLALNIFPTRGRATAILRKDSDHQVKWVRIRKV